MVHYNFIEIGTSNFSTEIQKSCLGKRGLSVDALQHYLDDLPNPEGVEKYCAIISDEDKPSGAFWGVSLENIKKYGLPTWARGCNNYGDKPHRTISRILTKKGLDPNSIFTRSEVEVISFSKLISDRSVTECDYLKVDTEGHDTFIIKNMLKTDLRPKEVEYENNCLTPAKLRRECKELMIKAGYRVVFEKSTNIRFIM